MHPILFEVGSFTVYTYGFCIAIGAVLGFSYMAWQGKMQFGITVDQSNTLFLLLVTAGVVGGKLFTVFEDPTNFFKPQQLLSGTGFVFYGALLFCIPVMAWFFRKHRIPAWAMLDVMAVVTCIVHGFGRLGCLMAGCCYGTSTDSFLSIVFTNPVCLAQPLNTPLHPTQVYESVWILIILGSLIALRGRRQFEGQLFLLYLIAYAAGRGVLELLRGDLERGFVFQKYVSNSQLISLLVIAGAVYFYVRRRNANLLSHPVS
jgi:phosphatidylglycerol:prolipoprotein diacylglycerol transferase